MLGKGSENDSSTQYRPALIMFYKVLYCHTAWEQMTESTEAYQNSAETPMKFISQLQDEKWHSSSTQ